MRRILLLAILFVAIAAGPALAGSGRPESPSPVAEVGKPAPDFALKDLQGNTVRLSDLRGKVVFLNFWASWCPPCRAEMPAMERLYEAMGGKDFAMLAVNVEDDLKAVKNFVADHSHAFPVLLDPKAEVQDLYRVYRFPETFLIDKQGTIIQHYVGARDWSNVDFLQYALSLAGK